MPTFFSRKYMRGRPKRTEQWVGGFVLGLTAFIGLSFLLTGGLYKQQVEASSVLSKLKNIYGISEKPLFVADEANLTPPAPPHEQDVAEAMLPKLGDSLRRAEVWASAVRPGEEFVASLQGDAEKALGTVAQEFDARWMYTTWYDIPAPEQRPPRGQAARVYILDMGTPASAFGMWYARKPTESERVNLGRAGWKGSLAGSEFPAIGFWSGRYYTEVWRTGRSDVDTVTTASGAASPVIDVLSSAAAQLQLKYGGPFWANRVLPKQERLADTFRYVRSRGLGLEELFDCWLAEYDGGVTLAVTDHRGIQREKLLSALRERLGPASEASAAEGGEEASAYGESEEGYGASEESYGGAEEGYGGGGYGSEGESYAAGGGYGDGEATGTGAGPAAQMQAWVDSVETEAVVGEWDGRVLAAYTTPEYVFVAIGDDGERMSTLAQATYDRWGMPRLEGTMLAKAPIEESKSGQARFAEIPGGRILAPATIERYTDDVYAKINGKEGAFRAFHFQELRFGRYAVAGTKDAYDVYIYDMNEPVNAFGMYRSERSYSAEPAEIGRAGYLSGTGAFFWKDRYYINVLGPPEESEEHVEVSLKIAKALDETIADDGKTFWADGVLPKEDRVPDSLAYQATNALTYEFLERMFIATYETDAGEEYEMFVAKYDTPERAREIFDQYAAATSEIDEVVAEDKTEDYAQLVSESLGYFTAAFVSGEYFGGVMETDSKEIVMNQAERFRKTLLRHAEGATGGRASLR